MNQIESEDLPEIIPVKKRPQSTRRQSRGRTVSISRMQDGKPIQFGTFPEAVIGEPLEQRILPFIEERNFGPGNWKVDIRNAKGHFERSFDFTTIGNALSDDVEMVDVDEDPPAETDEDDQELDLHTAANGMMTGAEVENLLLKERLRRLEEESRRRQSNENSEAASMLSMLQQSWNQQREFMMLMLQQSKAEFQRPQVDATAQALDLMEKSFSMVTKARAFADEIAPGGGGGEGSGSILADGAKLIDSVGRHAGTFLPIVASVLTRPGQTSPQTATGDTSQGVYSNSGTGEFAGLAAKARKAKHPAAVDSEKAEGASA